MDPLAAVFVFCFVFGVATGLLSLVLGALHGAGGDGGHALGGDHGGLHLGAGGGDGAHAVAHAGGAGGGDDLHLDLAEGQGGQVSPFNLQTITTFLAFFGGSGWVLYGSAGLAPALALIAATVVGVAGGAVVFLFLVKVLISRASDSWILHRHAWRARSPACRWRFARTGPARSCSRETGPAGAKVHGAQLGRRSPPGPRW